MRRLRLMFALAMLCAVPHGTDAQWLSLPLPGTPRTADGKANLNAPAPKAPDGKPDLSGIWKADSMRYNDNLLPQGVEAPMLPWAAEAYTHRVATMGYERPMTFCMPHGVPDAFTTPMPFKIIQTPGDMIILFEEFHKYRQVHTDGRKLPEDPDPSWMGTSIGRWEGNDFVVETAGFNTKTWLDRSGHAHSDKLKVTERFRRTDRDHLQIDFTIEDPIALAKPWKATFFYELRPNWELGEISCSGDYLNWTKKEKGEK